ncbi:CitMHS family transporter [Catalinimonas niigatensis]|uniref:CitMHS family transporter n=1 Tax=Catalinimonas niigatensis TaxID=1397264 RepID=UPI002666FBE3|nr:citrate:proton symporter [Catalinimonas niigatensis]WPP50638.1 citrate:proton symporter [Catalinimonas niigatensis]
MLAILGVTTIVALLFLVMTKKASAVVALILVPVITGAMAGLGVELVDFITEGIKSIAPTGVMFIFAILFFGILTDAGTFRPIINRLLKLAGNDPARVAVASALLAMIVHLDGSGAVTFLVTIPAFLTVYDQLKMRRSTLACIVALAAGTMNIVPWGGPTIRAATALDVPVTALFNPILFPVLIGLATVLFIAYMLGKKERSGDVEIKTIVESQETNTELERPRLFWLNMMLIISAVGLLISGLAPPHVIFMVAFVIAISLNYPNVKDQAKRIDAHAKAAMLMASILFAAGCFTGILKGSGMIDAMAESAVMYIPDAVGNHLPVIIGILSMPASLLFDPDSFYFGILPLLAATTTHFGGDSIEIGRAAIMGQMTTGFPISPLTGATFLLIGLTGVDLGDHQKKTIPYAFLITMIILTVSLLIGAITF